MNFSTTTARVGNTVACAAFLISTVLTVGCSADKGAQTDSTAKGAGAPPAAAVAASPDTATPAPSAAPTGDPDHDFLRAMTDHHKGLILMAHATIDSKDSLGVKALAERIDSEQDDEMDKMSTMLEKDFKDPYAPKASAGNQAMADQLKGKTGADYDHTFLENVIKHHQESLKMIDDYLPKAKNAKLKAMAEQMKTTKTKEIAEFQKKLAK